MKTKKFTILHSNDMHGDFLAEVKEGKSELIGGLALLSGYINQVRKEEENVFFMIAGDMLQGSVIDTEYKGISTMEIMNYLAPDVVTLGNHEFDYGLPHLLFLEKVANFPIVNANLYIKKYNRRIMKPYIILKKAGFEILVTGIVTEKTIDSFKSDSLIGTFVSIEEANAEIGKICNAYKNDDIDLTIVLSHIGFESDKELAGMLHPDWGVDIIIGGHSHTELAQPEKINNVFIAQAASGTNQIGRFDILVDDDTNSITECKWKLIPINSRMAEPDKKLLKYIETLKKEVDKKYSVILCKLTHEHTHPKREIETELGNLFADAFATIANCDVMFCGSGSIRSKQIGPMMTLGDLKACFPYNDSLTKFKVTGEQLKKIFSHIMRTENRNNEGECYQVNEGVKAIYNDKKGVLEFLQIKGKSVVDKEIYTICLQGYHASNCAEYLRVSQEEMLKNGPAKVVSTSAQEVLIEYFRDNQNIGRKVEGRLLYE